MHEFPDKFVIRPVKSPGQGFSIARSDGTFRNLDGEVNLETASRMYTIFGVAGTIRLLAGTYVLVITSRKEVGTYLGYPVFRVISMKFLSCNEGLSNLNNQQKKRRGLLPDIVENCRGDSWIVLFLRNRYYIKLTEKI